MPQTNTTYWQAKIAGNVRRDRSTDSALHEAGWTVIRIWEHEDPVAAALAVATAVTANRPPEA